MYGYPSQEVQLFAAPYDPWVGWGGVACASEFLCAHTKRARRQNLHATARDAGLSPSAGTSLLKRSAGARRAVSVLVPRCE
eukprot:scaffold26137_cov82-Phaeocystis_antarctica.AAC.2